MQRCFIIICCFFPVKFLATCIYMYMYILYTNNIISKFKNPQKVKISRTKLSRIAYSHHMILQEGVAHPILSWLSKSMKIFSLKSFLPYYMYSQQNLQGWFIVGICWQKLGMECHILDGEHVHQVTASHTPCGQVTTAIISNTSGRGRRRCNGHQRAVDHLTGEIRLDEASQAVDDVTKYL